jgi:S-adenosylmethionine/arginine decarboxylase-like enzyme
MSFTPFHQHLLIKGRINQTTKKVEELNKWLIDLVHKVEMEVLAGPNSVYCDHPGNEGITGTIVLSTSHSSIHIWDSENPFSFQFDLYSCKKFEVETVLKHIDDLFSLYDYEYLMIDRNGNMKISDQGAG